MLARKQHTGWGNFGDGGEVTPVKSTEEINFGSDPPELSSNRRVHKRNRAVSKQIPLGEGRYKDTDLDFEVGLPKRSYEVRIQKSAVEVQSNNSASAPVRYHNFTSSKKVSTRVDKYKSDDTNLSPVATITNACMNVAPIVHKQQLRSVIDDEKMIQNAFPEVLTWEAVRANKMPSLGQSALPESLEKDVPPEFRYWLCNTITDAKSVRDALVESCLFIPDTVKKVDGEWRRAVVETVQKLYLPPTYDGSEAVVIPPTIRPIDKVAGFLEPSQSDRHTVLFDETIVGVIGINAILEKARNLNADFVIAAQDSPEVRKAIGGAAFKLKSRDDLVFATNVALVNENIIRWVQLERTDELLKFAFSEGRTIPLYKSDTEERIVFGIVLEPETLDAQNDIISKEEIKQACYKFMENFGNLGLQHKEIVNGKLRLLENYIAPVDFYVAKQSIKEGTWLMKERIVDDTLWVGVKKGEYTGFSIGGSGVRKPVR